LTDVDTCRFILNLVVVCDRVAVSCRQKKDAGHVKPIGPSWLSKKLPGVAEQERPKSIESISCKKTRSVCPLFPPNQKIIDEKYVTRIAGINPACRESLTYVSTSATHRASIKRPSSAMPT
jgi:hypothetical protein